MPYSNIRFSGLTSQEVEASRKIHGRNRVEQAKGNPIGILLRRAAGEPMLLLLLATSAIYFIHGDMAEGIFLSIAVVLVSSISFYQESRSKKALETLRNFSKPVSRVIRDSHVIELSGEELVVGDYVIVEEGSLIAADGRIVQANDFTVNESVVTGESLPVAKAEVAPDNLVYQGTYVVSGLAICEVTHIGAMTKVGLIGQRLHELKTEASPLQLQINSFVKRMAAVGIAVFALLWAISAYRSQQFLDSLLQALTVAMSILPEEIPVAFVTFMALGAWRLMKLGMIVKQTRTVETLGSATVICADKTGTLTKNEMRLDKVYVHGVRTTFDRADKVQTADVIRLAMWASEPVPFDAMEKEIHQVYADTCDDDLRPAFKLVHEYPLGGKPPLMTHVFQNAAGQRIIAAKGAPEAILAQSTLTAAENQAVSKALEELTHAGYRVLGVGEAVDVAGLPATQQEFKFAFQGLVAFHDPPKENIQSVIHSFYQAGIDVKILTGDNLSTAMVIAQQIGMKNLGSGMTGEQFMQLAKDEQSAAAKQTTLFARMFPEAKLSVIEALKKQNEVVAMTGDGINDGPALKAAHIGIAMGKKGSEIAKEASALILIDDDLGRMVDGIAMGRKIYNNLKKAIQYIISIHIPIILIVFLPQTLGWVYPTLFTPIHVIFLELIMGPTCSIVYENEPLEKNLMVQKPRPFTNTFFNFKELSISIAQGLMITAGLLVIYFRAVSTGATEHTTTAMVFVTLMTANIMLTLVNRSFYYSLLNTLRYPNRMIIAIIVMPVLLIVTIFTFQAPRNFFDFERLLFSELAQCVVVGLLSVLWFEGYKLLKRKRNLHPELSPDGVFKQVQ